MTSQETVGACLLELTQEAFESVTPILSSTGMILWLEQSLESEVGTVVLEEVLLLSSFGANAPALAVSERVHALERNELVVVEAAGVDPGGARQRSGTESLDGVQSQILAELRAMGSRLAALESERIKRGVSRREAHQN